MSAVRMSTVVWPCIRLMGDDKTLELMGVFTSESAAIAACSTERDFIGPIELDERAPEESVPWAGCYYPLATTQAEIDV